MSAQQQKQNEKHAGRGNPRFGVSAAAADIDPILNSIASSLVRGGNLLLAAAHQADSHTVECPTS